MLGLLVLVYNSRVAFAVNIIVKLFGEEGILFFSLHEVKKLRTVVLNKKRTMRWSDHAYNFESNQRTTKLFNTLMWEYYIRFVSFNNIVMLSISGPWKCEGNKHCQKEILNTLYLTSNKYVLGKNTFKTVSIHLILSISEHT